MIVDRRFRLARLWSNKELRKIAPSFLGRVVNVSAWDDRDKEGGHYRDYFVNASSYSYTNYTGYKGLQGKKNEYLLDLAGEVPESLRGAFDVAFNHTTLEHVFEVRRAFKNLCELSKDVVVVIVPFAQIQHESDDWKDYWRFTPTCLRMLYEENGLTVVYETATSYKNSAVYLLVVGSRRADYWRTRMPAYQPIDAAGRLIGRSLSAAIWGSIRKALRGRANGL